MSSLILNSTFFHQITASFIGKDRERQQYREKKKSDDEKKNTESM
jgi:hypothetical protein